MFKDISYHATHTQTGPDGKKFQCKMTSGVIDPGTNEDWAMVSDGTTCGPPNSHKVNIKLFFHFSYKVTNYLKTNNQNLLIFNIISFFIRYA